MTDLFFIFIVSFLKYMTWWHHTCLCWIWSCHHCFWKEWFVWTIFHSDFCCKWPLGCHGQMGPPPFFVAFPNCSTCISMIIVVFLMYTSTQHLLLLVLEFWNSAIHICNIFHFRSLIFNVLPNIVPGDFVLKGYVLCCI